MVLDYRDIMTPALSTQALRLRRLLAVGTHLICGFGVRQGVASAGSGAERDVAGLEGAAQPQVYHIRALHGQSHRRGVLSKGGCER